MSMQIILNGNPRDVPAQTTVADLLRELDVAVPHVAVEINREIVPRAEHAQHRLREGDALEVVTLVGGG